MKNVEKQRKNQIKNRKIIKNVEKVEKNYQKYKNHQKC